jgi:hypothetical protein
MNSCRLVGEHHISEDIVPPFSEKVPNGNAGQSLTWAVTSKNHNANKEGKYNLVADSVANSFISQWLTN